MRDFLALGERIEREWRARDYRDADLADVAVRALAEAGLPGSLDAFDVVRWLHASGHVPAQEDRAAEFSSLPVTVYRGPRFFVAVLFWLEGTTSVHQHSFDGAFQVLLGSSLHGVFDFAEEREINPHLLLGRLRLERMEMLRVGDVRPIRSGGAFIHSLFHLDHPSATIVVRTYRSALAGPQYDYEMPGVAVDSFFADEVMQRRLQSVSLLLRARRPDGLDMLERFLEGADFQTSFHALERVAADAPDDSLERMFGLPGTRETFERLLAVVRRRHGTLADVIPAVFEARGRKERIVDRRRVVTDPEHRFFLAVLLNAPSRTPALDLVRARFPEEDPVEKVLDWVDELATTRVVGSADAAVLDADLADGDGMSVLRCLLEGRALEEAEAELDADSPGEPGRAAALAEALRGSLLRPLVVG